MQVFIFILLAVRIVAADDPLPGTIFDPIPKGKQGDFDPPKAPLRPTDFPNWQDPVNRDRVFDFYAKEAIAYLDGKLPSGILPAYLGLDGGQQGHWGNQNDDVTWKDNRWAASDHGHLFSGVFNDAGQFVAKGVWVREGELNGCFDPSSLRFRAKWKGGFLKLSARRHGFNTAAEINGEPFTSESARKLSDGDVYHGFYRQGEKVIFSYTLGGKEYTETLSGGRKERDSVQLARGGATRWPGWIETSGKIGTGDEFAADTLVLPTSNPYGTLFFVSGFDFFPDGSIALCTMTGEVWLVRGIDTTLIKLQWKRFATGLHQPLGLKVINGDILVMGRDQVTRLVDLNGDNEADFYECLTNAHTTSYGSHDYIVGLDTDHYHSSFWMQRDGADPSNGGVKVLWNLNGYYDNQHVLLFHYQNKLHIQFNNQIEYQTFTSAANVNIFDYERHHIVIDFNHSGVNNFVKIYVDAVLVLTANIGNMVGQTINGIVSVGPNDENNNRPRLSVGCLITPFASTALPAVPTLTKIFIDEIHWAKASITAGQVTSLYNAMPAKDNTEWYADFFVSSAFAIPTPIIRTGTTITATPLTASSQSVQPTLILVFNKNISATPITASGLLVDPGIFIDNTIDVSIAAQYMFASAQLAVPVVYLTVSGQPMTATIKMISSTPYYDPYMALIIQESILPLSSAYTAYGGYSTGDVD